MSKYERRAKEGAVGAAEVRAMERADIAVKNAVIARMLQSISSWTSKG